MESGVIAWWSCRETKGLYSGAKELYCVAKGLCYDAKVEGSLRFAQRLDYEPYLRRRVCPRFVRGDQCMKAAPQCGVEIYPLVQLAEGGLRAKSRTVELGKFRAPVCTYLESFHIF